MSDPTVNPLEYYTDPGLMTELKTHAGFLAGLPDDVPGIARLVQGQLLHIFWAERYGVTLSDARKDEVNIRSAAEMLTRIRAEDSRPLTVARTAENRLVGNCRDFSTLTCALLRFQGIPARARCGFASYFEPGKYVDHWVCEYWSLDQNRWVMVDAQIDPFQAEALKIDFDPLDVPPNRFFIGGSAWQLCRAGEADPDTFGIFDMWGLWFVRGNLLRDLASLNKVELLPWDCWGLVDKDEAALTDDDFAVLDQVAALTIGDDESFAETRTLFADDSRLRVPQVIRSYVNGEMKTIDLDDPAQRL